METWSQQRDHSDIISVEIISSVKDFKLHKQNSCQETCWVVAHFDVCYQNACLKTTGSIKFHLKPKYWFCQVTPSGTCLSIATCLSCIYFKAGKFPKRKYVVDNLKVETFSFRARSYAIELAGVKRHIFYPLCTSFIWTL